VTPFLQKAGVIEDQHTLRVAEMLDYVVTHSVDVPVSPPQQALHPVRRQLTGALSQGPTVDPVQARDQPGQVLPGPPSHHAQRADHEDEVARDGGAVVFTDHREAVVGANVSPAHCRCSTRRAAS
jgi:hypothetical protein